jgi:organic hydroperoxide reductase OsmC/OhrA
VSETHRYTATVGWEGSTALGYDAYDRTHRGAVAQAGASFTLSADRAFRGDPTLVNPEQLLLLAAASCQLLSFLAVAARARIDVSAYEDDAEAEMPEQASPVRITRIVLRPIITVRSHVSDERIRHLVEVAHRECYIANSVSSEMVIEPVIRRASA